jgi:hypothetical protein
LAKKFIVIAIIIGITLGSVGTYFSNYALNLFGIDEISIPSMDEEKQMGAQMQSTPKSILTNELQYSLVEVKKTDFGINGEKPLEGGVFLITKIEIENFGKQEVIVYGNATPEKNENIFSIRIPPGFKITQNIGFEIPSKLESKKELYVADRAFESEPIFLGTV